MNKQNSRQKIKLNIVILSCLCFAFFTSAPVHADDTLPVSLPTITPSEYKLPYPGLLPDSPLYFLKAFRDNVAAFFIGKPVDKAEFMLLQSDKQVAASYMLLTQEKDKTDLAVKTFGQAQDDFDEAIEQTQLAKKQGMEVRDMAKKLADAQQKHLQVLDQIDQQINAAAKQKFQEIRTREIAFVKTLKSLQQ